MERIDPAPPSGFQDFGPTEAASRQALLDRVAAVFARWGFSPLDTPALERIPVLTGGDDAFSKQLYRARITDDDEPLGLRFDLTVPLARFVAANADSLSFPFMRYAIGNVWRGEHPQAGRYRQFVQCDADIIGAHRLTADAQIIALSYAVFKELGLADGVRIRISNRKVLAGLPEFLGFPTERLPGVLRAVDKLGKQGWAPVLAELTEKHGLTDQQADGIQELLKLEASDADDLLTAADEYLKFTPVSHQGIEELRELAAHLDALDLPRTAWQMDLSIARGLGYYTGTVFETFMDTLPNYGSVCSGGRYDDLVARFSPLKLSGVGMSVGADRLLAALDELGRRPAVPDAGPRIALLDFDDAARPKVLAAAAALRSAGISATLYAGGEHTLKGQLSWAIKSGFPRVAIMGASEAAKDVVQLKDTSARTQEEVPLKDLVKHLG